MADLEQKTVTLPSGLAVTFRRPGPLTNIAVVKGIPSLAATPLDGAIREAVRYRAKKAGKDLPAAEVVVVTLGSMNAKIEEHLMTLCLCSIEPRLTMSYPPEPGKTSLEALPGGEKDFNVLLAEWVAFNNQAEEAAEIAPLSKAARRSNRSTSSGARTAEDLPALSVEN